MIAAFIPSPSQGTWQIGFFELRAYALCIIAGVLVAVWLGNRRWVARGGRAGTVADIAVWAVPFGLVGARLYHVATDWQLYFCSTCDPVQALYIWRGGLGIWGAVSLGALGAWIGCRRHRISFPAFGDAIVPAIAVAQGIGRFGNWFNQELFGKPTTLPWGLEIDRQFRPPGFEQFATFQPTFAYEALWDFGIAGLLVWADRRFRLGHGRVIALYIMAYTAGRGWIEMLRIDEANHILGLRLNVWTSILVFLFGLICFVWSARRHPGRETPAELGGEPVAAAATPETAAASGDETPEPDGAEGERSAEPEPPESEPEPAEAEPEPAEAEAAAAEANVATERKSPEWQTRSTGRFWRMGRAAPQAEPVSAEPVSAEPGPAEPVSAEPVSAKTESAQPSEAQPAASESHAAADEESEAESEPGAKPEPQAVQPAPEPEKTTEATSSATTPSATTTKPRKPRRRWGFRRRR